MFKTNPIKIFDMGEVLRELNAQNPIGLPTETVYGLAADATSDIAVSKIYALKERPSFNPLIIHVDSLEMAKEFGVFNETAEMLAKRFWHPSHFANSLTIVVALKKDAHISKLALAGLNTVAMRVPNHPIALDVIRAFGKPIAAPSANISNKISATTYQHVKKYFPNLLVINGGDSLVGLESTIIDATSEPISILRAGIVTAEMLSAVMGYPVGLHLSDSIKAPGQLKRHYAPKTKLVINAEIIFSDLKENEALLGFGDALCTKNLSARADLLEAAANLFRFLHEMDHGQYQKIYVVPIPSVGIGLAINDRLTRASS